MKIKNGGKSGFTFTEVMVAMGVGLGLMAATVNSVYFTAKELNAVEHYFYTHMQQVRIIDYLSRDVKRSVIVTTSTDQQTVTCKVPEYIIQPGDADAGPGDVNVGMRRTPTILHGEWSDRRLRSQEKRRNHSAVSGITSTLTSVELQFWI